jgi:DNA-binding CsgD family transcriptional regulator
MPSASDARKQARELRDLGYSDVQTARRLAVTRQTIRRWLGPKTSRTVKQAALEEGVRRLRAGEGPAAVAAAVGVSADALRRRARQAGIARPSSQIPAPILSHASSLRAQGLSDREIARQLGIPRRRLAVELGGRGRAGFCRDRRLARMATCLTLYQRGMTQREIAQALNVNRATVHRALAYAREQGIDVPQRQKVMLPQYRRLWTTEELLEKAREWAAIYDRPPVSSEWNPWHPHHSENQALGVDRIERFYQGEWRFTESITGAKYQRPWKTWNGYLRDAGLEPLPHGYHYVADDDGKAVRIDGKRLIHSNDHRREYLEGERLGR